jgi:hypothetical protein
MSAPLPPAEYTYQYSAPVPRLSVRAARGRVSVSAVAPDVSFRYSTLTDTDDPVKTFARIAKILSMLDENL